MRRICAALIFLFPLAAAAAESGHFATASGLHFFAGEVVDVDTRGADSIFAAGGDVTVGRAQAEHVFAAGRRVRLADTDVEDVFIAGREVEIAGAVADDVFAAGETVTIASGATIGGDGLLAARTLRFQGRADGDLLAAAARIELGGAVAGDVMLSASEIVLSPGLTVGGALTYRGPATLDIPAGVTVTGAVTRAPWPEESAGRSTAGTAVAVVLALVALALFAAVVLLLAPRLVDLSMSEIKRAPLVCLLIGLAAVVGLPVLAVLACLTLIGIPLGIFLFTAGCVGFGMAAVNGWHWLGAAVFDLASSPPRASFGGRFAAAAAGLSLFVVAGYVPVLGIIAQTVVILLGYGALVRAARPPRAGADPALAPAT